MSRRKGKKRKQSTTSLIIPVVAGVVVVALIVGFIALSEARRPPSASGPGSVAEAGDTALPLGTQSIPYPNVSRTSLQEARDGMASGQVVLVDVRSKESFDKSHAAGAISIPEAEIDARLGELPRDKEVVLYCT